MKQDFPETVFMVRPGLGLDPLHLEDLPPAPDTGVLVPILSLRLTLLPEVVLAARTVELLVTNLAVDLVIRSLDTVEVVQLGLTLEASEAPLVVEATLGDHLLGLEDLPVAPAARFSVSVLALGEVSGTGEERVVSPG